MPVVPNLGPWLRPIGPDLLTQAASILDAEVARAKVGGLALPVPSALPAGSGTARHADGGFSEDRISGPLTCPITGATIPAEASDRLPTLGLQFEELLTTLLALSGRRDAGHDVPSSSPTSAGLGSIAEHTGRTIRQLADRLYPITGGAIPIARPQRDVLRRQAHELIEALLITFSQATGEQGASYDDRVPLLHGRAPAAAGSEATAAMRVVNDEAAPAEVSLYCTNFVGDSGHEIPSRCVTTSPRVVTIPSKADTTFEIKIGVPQQAAQGVYTGLIQVMGCRYVRAVLSIEVL